LKSLLFYILPLLIACFTAGQSKAQYATKDFKLYSVKNGLSDNQVNCLQQDDNGYLWIGTKGGLNRFDGMGFKKFYQGSEPINLPSDIITRLKKIGPHALGIFSRGGLQVLHTDTYKVSRYIIADSTAFTTPLNAVWDASKLDDGSFAITTAAGFYILNEKEVTYRHDAFNIEDIGRKQVLYGRDIFNVGNGNLVVYTNEDEQLLYNGKTKTLVPLSNDNVSWGQLSNPRNFPGDRWVVKRQLNKHSFIFISQKSDSIIFYNSERKQRVASPLPASFAKQLNWESEFEIVGDSVLLLNSGYTGFFRLRINMQSGSINAGDQKFLPEFHIKCFLTDREGRLWLGTTKGLLKQELVAAPLTAFQYPTALPAPADYISSLYRYKNIIYAGRYSRHHGLCIIDAITMKRIKEIQFYGSDVPWNEVISIEMYHPDTLWIGTWAGLLWYDIKTEHYGKLLDEGRYPWAANFSAILAPPRSDGYAWLCAFMGGRVVRYHIPTRSFIVFSPQSKQALPFEKVKNIVYDSYGDVWISGHSLTRFNNQLQRFDTLIKVYAGNNKFNNDIVTISADDNGSLWLHNADNGLLEYKIREKRFVPYTMRDGLPFALFHSLSDVVGGNLWICNVSKLCMMDTKLKQFTVYDENDGLPDRIPSNHHIFFDSIDRVMYLCMEDYLVRFSSSAVPKIGNGGTLQIEELTINNDATLFQPLDKIELNYPHNSFSLQFAVVDFERNNYQYAFRIGNDTDWNSIGNQHNVSFNNLSPGEYLVELSAIGKTGSRKTKSVVIIIKPPFWATTWFICLSIGCLLALLFGLFFARMKRLRQKTVIDKQLMQTQMKALQAQMNPHFIFNSLNSIREMILSEANNEASHYLSQFAQLIRITLEQSTRETVLLSSTIDYLHLYIEMETIRNGLLKYEIQVDPSVDPDETLVSPMIIQPFVENAIWHGVSAVRKDIFVKIVFKKAGGLLSCTIDDNGVGITQSRSQKQSKGKYTRSHGIVNVEDRVNLLNDKYDLRCSITVIDKREKPELKEPGTLVTILLPYQTTEL